MSDHLEDAFSTWLNRRAADIAADPENPIAKANATRNAFTAAIEATLNDGETE